MKTLKIENLQKIVVANKKSEIEQGLAKEGYLINSRKDYEMIKNSGLPFLLFVGKKWKLSDFFIPVMGYFSSFEDARLEIIDFLNYRFPFRDHTSETAYIKDVLAELSKCEYDKVDDYLYQLEDLIENYQNFKPGIYDLNGELIASESEFNDPDFCGFEHDSFRYNLIAVIF